MLLNEYIYSGPVYRFERVVIQKVTMRTMAASQAKAVSNITYRCKRSLGLLPTAKLSIDKNLLLEIAPKEEKEKQLSFL